MKHFGLCYSVLLLIIGNLHQRLARRMAHFYLVLPSNSSMQFYPNNTITQYKTKLQTAIELTGEWEVALAEMTFPKSWSTIPNQGAKFTFTCQVDPIDAQSMPDFLKNINFFPL